MAKDDEKSRVSKNDDLYKTKQERFNFEEFEDDLDNTFLMEYKNLNRQKNKKDKRQDAINRDLSNKLKQELKEQKQKSTINFITNIIYIISF